MRDKKVFDMYGKDEKKLKDMVDNQILPSVYSASNEVEFFAELIAYMVVLPNSVGKELKTLFSKILTTI